MTTQKQWHGSPGGTLTITSSLSQSLRWLMKRKSKGQLCIQARRPHHHLLWREQDGSRRWNAEGDLFKALRMAFHWYLAHKRVNMMCLILVWRSNCRNIRKEYGNLLAASSSRQVWLISIYVQVLDSIHGNEEKVKIIFNKSDTVNEKWVWYNQTTAPRSEQNTIKTIMNS